MHFAADERAQTLIEREPRNSLGLVWLVALLAAGGAFLYATAGLPHLPQRWPAPGEVLDTLRGYDFPLEAVAYLASTAAWLFWAWLMGTLALRLLVVAAEALTHGAAWVRSLRLFSDWITLPFVRRAVDATVAAALVVQVVGRAAPVGAAPLYPAAEQATIVVVAGAPAPDGTRVFAHDQREDGEGRLASYTVQPNDTLWDIARRFYGTGEEYPRLIQANLDRPMADGRVFDRRAVIHPGWALHVPLPSQAIEEDGRGRRWYVVEEGDTLMGVAARLLGDEERWAELFQLNQGTASLPDGRTLREPQLIWPGLRLRLPDPAPVPSVEQPAPKAPAATAPEPLTQPEPAPQASTPVPAPEPVEPQPVAPVPAAVPAPPMAAEPDTVDVEAPEQRDASPAAEAAGLGIAAVAAAGGLVALARRRRVRRSLDEPLPPRPAESDVVMHPVSGFAEADQLTRAFAHRVHGEEADPAILAVEQVARLLAEAGCESTQVVTAIHGRSATTLTVSAELTDQARLLDLAPRVGERLGGAGLASLTPDQDVQLRLSGIRRTQLLPPVGGRARHAALDLVPLGALPNRQVLYANWDALGHVLLASLPGQGAEVVLTSLLAALTARRSPGDLRLLTLARPRTLTPLLADLPHQHASRFIDPAEPGPLEEALAEVRDELERRMAQVDGGDWCGSFPEWMVVLGELADLPDDGTHATTLELLGVHGPAHGMRLLAASTGGGALRADLLAHFTTRVVFQTASEAESVELLGQPEAADLADEGQFLLRIDGREPIAARGFRIAEERFAHLLGLMQTTYGRGHGNPVGMPPPENEPAAPGLAPDEAGAAEEVYTGVGADGAGDQERAASAAPVVATPTFIPVIAAPNGALVDPSPKDGMPGPQYANGAHHTDGDTLLVKPMATCDETVSDQARRFLTLLGTAIDTGQAHVADQHGQAPADGRTWGWSSDAAPEDESDAATWLPRGRCVGWLVGDDLYLDPGSAYDIAAQVALGQGEPLSYGLGTLQKELATSGQLASTPASRETVRVRRTLGAQRRSVLHLPARALTGPADHEDSRGSQHAPGQAGEPSDPFAGQAAARSGGPDECPMADPTSETAGQARPAVLPSLDVQCFGGLVVRFGDRELVPRFVEGGRQKMTFAGWEALAYLAVHEPGGVPTERLAEAVNPGCREQQASSRLSVAVSRLRLALRGQVPGLPGDLVSFDHGGMCRLDTAVVRSDVHAFLALVRAAAGGRQTDERIEALERARGLYRGDLLGGAGGRYYGWLFEHESEGGVLLQDHYRQQFLRATRELARLYAETDQLPRAVQLYREILRAEPTAEDVVRDLYRCYEQLGDLSALLREDQRLRQAMRDAWAAFGEDDEGEDLDPADDDDPSLYEPEQETRALFERIRHQLEAAADGRRPSAPATASRAA